VGTLGRMILRFLASSALAAVVATAPLATARAATTADSTTTIFLVRHAEKDTLMVGADPPLSAVGMLRAQELARVLGDVRIAAIYVTPYQRNRQTAQPLATRLGDTLTVVNSIDSTVACLRTKHPGQTVLVVGHSNTLPQIIEQLSGEKIPPFQEFESDRLYVLTLAPHRPAKVLELRYGAAKAR
jgi:broad specificity phosphatase PhoE